MRVTRPTLLREAARSVSTRLNLKHNLSLHSKVQKTFELEGRPPEGVYINGLFMEGARWNIEGFIDESFNKILYDDFPPVSVGSCNLHCKQ